VRELCAAAAAGRQEALPVKRQRGVTPEIRQLCVIIERPRGGGQEVLLMQRPRGGIWEELWEFPALAAPARLNSLRRLSDEVERQLGLPVRLARHCGQVVHQLTHRRMVYDVVQGALDVARAKEAAWATAPSGAYQAARWVALEGLAEQVPVARVTRKLAACAGLGLTASGGAAAEVP
jgi:adenine-specific DNA glycosylase